MCGINGIFSSSIEIKRKIINQNKLLSHRGPDDEGFTAINTSGSRHVAYSGDDSVQSFKQNLEHIKTANFNNYNLFLGHRRLSIIDLSDKGHEPMCDSTGKIWITYNGEIYNYIELRSELLSYGFKFESNTDTEVIIYAYLKWGTDCVNHFNGMWAFGLWDGINEKLFLSRDRFGIKPLYYLISDDVFAFSSEIKPLTLLFKEKPEFNEDNIAQFLINGNRLGNSSTYIKNIFSLPPSHYLTFENGDIRTMKYYDIKNIDENYPEEKIKSDIDDLFTDSIKLRYRSDVKIGTCLSGGFDSSSIVAFSNKFLGMPLETFSAVWDDKSCDESKYIDLINARFNCNEHKIMPKEDEFEKIFERLHYFQEIPTEGPGLYPQWHIMQIAEGNVKVLLNGQGGDEVFGGYFANGTFFRSLLKDKSYGQIIKSLNQYFNFFRQNSLHTFSNWLFPRTYRRFVHKNASVHFKIFNNDFANKHKINKIETSFEPSRKFKHYINDLSYHFISVQTIPSLLHYEDRSSMAHSIESRVPFLDYRLVELGVNLKPQQLIKDGVSRPLFRSVVKDYLPKEIINRKDKLGYPTPFSKWVRTGLRDYVNCVFDSSNSYIYDYLNKDKISNLILKKHLTGENDFGWEIWRLLSLEKFIHLFRTQKYLSFL